MSTQTEDRKAAHHKNFSETVVFLVRDLRFFVACLALVSLVSLIIAIQSNQHSADASAQSKKVGVQAVAILQHIKRNSNINRRVLAEIDDCVTPSGACAKRGSDATAKAVGDISTASVITSACSPFIPAAADAPKSRYVALVECIQNLRRNLPPPPPPK